MTTPRTENDRLREALQELQNLARQESTIDPMRVSNICDGALEEIVDENWWEENSVAGLTITRDLLAIAKQIDDGLELRPNDSYIGLGRDGRSGFNFLVFWPSKKNACTKLDVKLTRSDEMNAKITQAGFSIKYNLREGCYRLKLSLSDLQNKRDFLREIIRLAYDKRMGNSR